MGFFLSGGLVSSGAEVENPWNYTVLTHFRRGLCMATITKRATGYQAQIRRRGFPTVSKMFDTKREAEAWTRMNETQMDQGIYLDRSEADKTTLNRPGF